MKGMIELVLKAEEARIGRAVKALISGAYKVEVIKRENSEIRAYVSHFKVEPNKEYAVVINSGKFFCSCRDRFINEHLCKHVLMVIFERLSELHKISKVEKNDEGGKKDDEGIVPNP